jgi:Concanavalin A-like lectin/glucanases superfamily
MSIIKPTMPRLQRGHPLARGLVGAWELTEGSGRTAYDSSGYGNHGTLTGFPTWVGGRSGSVLSFNGTTDYVSIKRTISDDFTLSVWFNTSSSAGTGGNWYFGKSLIDGEMTGTANDFGTSINQGKANFGCGNPDITIASPGTFNDSKWHLLTGTRVRNSGAMVLYIDGISVGSATSNTNSLTAPTSIEFGRPPSNYGPAYYLGMLDCVRIYDRALSATEVALMYAFAGP